MAETAVSHSSVLPTPQMSRWALQFFRSNVWQFDFSKTLLTARTPSEYLAVPTISPQKPVGFDPDSNGSSEHLQ